MKRSQDSHVVTRLHQRATRIAGHEYKNFQLDQKDVIID